MELISPTTKDTQEYFEDQQNTDENRVIYKDYNEDVSTPSALTPLFFHRKRKKQLKLKTTCLSPALVLYMVVQLGLLRQKSTLRMTVVW